MSNADHPKIGRYEVLTQLSVGGMAELFLACVSGAGGFRKYVALKRILPAFKTQDEFIAMFLDEARITAALSHANIAQVFELGEDGNDFYIAMEFVEGQDLARINRAALRKKKKIPVGFAAGVIRDACNALHYAHHFTSPSGRPLPVIHRDLSLRNIMVNYSGTTKLIDFGIAKAKGQLSSTRAGIVKGSSGYMSPEQIRGEELDGTSDLFTAGAVLYELVTGRRMFQGGDQVATMYKVLNDAPTPPHLENPEVPVELSDVLLRSLEKDRSRRFSSGREMAKAIDHAIRVFDEDERTEWMAENFADAIASTRKMLSLAGDEDAAVVAQAADSLKEINAPGAISSVSKVPEGTGATIGGLAPMPDEAATAAAKAPKREATILVVDDTRVGRMLVESVLKAEGHRVIDAESGAEALEVLEHLKPDLIVLDVRMPGMDGFELCQKIRLRPDSRTTPVVFLSAACSLDERVQGLSVGGDDFIRKPFDGAELVARVRVHLQRAAMMAGLKA